MCVYIYTHMYIYMYICIYEYIYIYIWDIILGCANMRKAANMGPVAAWEPKPRTPGGPQRPHKHKDPIIQCNMV